MAGRARGTFAWWDEATFISPVDHEPRLTVHLPETGRHPYTNATQPNLWRFCIVISIYHPGFPFSRGDGVFDPHSGSLDNAEPAFRTSICIRELVTTIGATLPACRNLTRHLLADVFISKGKVSVGEALAALGTRELIHEHTSPRRSTRSPPGTASVVLKSPVCIEPSPF